VFVIETLVLGREANGISNVSGDRHETLQKISAIATHFEVFGLCGGKITGFLDQDPCSINWNVFTHN